MGDVVEQVYNAHTGKSRVLYPYRVEKIHTQASDEEECVGLPRYEIVRLVDGFRLEYEPESYLRRYLPYTQDAKVLCNVGGYGMKIHLSPCSIQEVYDMNSPTETEYLVRVQGEEEELKFPVERLLRHAPY